MSAPHATVTVNVHATPDAIFSALARVFPVTAFDKVRWVQVPSDGVTVTFYAEYDATTDDATTDDATTDDATADDATADDATTDDATADDATADDATAA